MADDIPPDGWLPISKAIFAYSDPVLVVEYRAAAGRAPVGRARRTEATQRAKREARAAWRALLRNFIARLWRGDLEASAVVRDMAGTARRKTLSAEDWEMCLSDDIDFRCERVDLDGTLHHALCVGPARRLAPASDAGSDTKLPAPPAFEYKKERADWAVDNLGPIVEPPKRADWCRLCEVVFKQPDGRILLTAKSADDYLKGKDNKARLDRLNKIFKARKRRAGGELFT